MEHNATAPCPSPISVNLISVPLKGSQYFPSKRPKHSTRLHGVISQNTILFTVTTYTTSNLTHLFRYEKWALEQGWVWVPDSIAPTKQKN